MKTSKDTVKMAMDVKFAQGYLYAQKDSVCQNYANGLSWIADFLRHLNDEEEIIDAKNKE